jgi:hypothetical protein
MESPGGAPARRFATAYFGEAQAREAFEEKAAFTGRRSVIAAALSADLRVPSLSREKPLPQQGRSHKSPKRKQKGLATSPFRRLGVEV